jgi:hypothetical protein
VKDYKQYRCHHRLRRAGRLREGSTVGVVLNMMRNFADETDDPGKFVVETVIRFLPTRSTRWPSRSPESWASW